MHLLFVCSIFFCVVFRTGVLVIVQEDHRDEVKRVTDKIGEKLSVHIDLFPISEDHEDFGPCESIRLALTSKKINVSRYIPCSKVSYCLCISVARIIVLVWIGSSEMFLSYLVILSQMLLLERSTTSTNVKTRIVLHSLRNIFLSRLLGWLDQKEFQNQVSLH